MVFRSNLDDNSISFPPWSTRPRRTRPVAPTKTHLHIDMWIWAMYPYLVRIPLRHTCLVVPTVFFFFPPFKNKYCLIWLGYIFDTFPWYKIWTTKKNPLCCRRQGPQRVVQSGSIFQWWNQHPLDIDTPAMVLILPPLHRLKSLVCCVCAPASARLWVCLRHWVWHFDSYSKSLYRTSLFKLTVYH